MLPTSVLVELARQYEFLIPLLLVRRETYQFARIVIGSHVKLRQREAVGPKMPPGVHRLGPEPRRPAVPGLEPEMLYGYFFRDMLHNYDAPAARLENGATQWYLFGRLHRDGGPAHEGDFFQEWYRHGQLHKDDGPAFVYEDYFCFERRWYRNGRSHRDEDEPARIMHYRCERREFCEFHGPYEAARMSERRIPRTPSELMCGLYWYHHGKLHRTGKPAYIGERIKKWFQDGELHRDDGPAIESEYFCLWFCRGRLHRVGGPAIESQGKNDNDTSRLLQWVLAETTPFQDLRFRKMCKYIYKKVEIWCQDDAIHRDDGPAVVWANGKEKWYHRGVVLGKDGGPPAPASAEELHRA